MNIFTRTSVIALPLLIATLIPYYSVAQKKSGAVKTPEPNSLLHGRMLSLSVQRCADSTLRIAQYHSDSLKSLASLTATKVSMQLDALADSLIISARDSLDFSRRDTLRFVTISFRRQLLAFGDTSQRAVSYLLDHFSTELMKGRNVFSVCDSCENDRDFNDRLEEFRDFVQNLDETYRDTTSTLMEDQQDTFQDRYETVRDSLADLRDCLIDNRLDDLDYQRYVATRLVVSTGYSSHATYRGRDNGVPQQMLAPSIAFHHSSGLGAELSTFLLNQTPNRLDDIALCANYEFTLGSILGVDLTYSHFWFSDSSRSSQSVFKNAIGASLSLNWPVLTLGIEGDLAIGSASEFTVAPSISHSFEIPLTLYDKVSIEPTLTAAIGEQNSTLTTLRLGPKGKRVIGVQTKTSNTFGILEYAASLPVTLEWGRVTLAPILNYVVPVNVVDLSTKNSFVSFDFSISVAIR